MNTLWGTKNSADFTGTEGYDGADIGLANDIAAAQTTGVLAALGVGIVKGGAVTAGAGLSVDIAPVLAIASHSTTGACALQLTVAATPRTVPASSTRNLFLGINTTGDAATDSRATRVPALLLSELGTIDGAVLLASVTTDATTVTGVVDARAFVAGNQQPANPDTSGAALSALETEVNELKAALRAVGILAP